MRVYVLCEFSAEVRDAFARRGHDAWSCDLLPSERGGKHFQMDCRLLDYTGVDLVIAHPPCQYLSYAGNVWMKQLGRREKRDDAMTFFMWVYSLPVAHLAVENPPGYPRQAFRPPDQTFHPYHFGHPVRKATCLWLRGLPLLRLSLPDAAPPPPVYIDGVTGRNRNWVDTFPGNKDRAKNRSRTFHGIAEAMAEQWGSP